MKVDDFLNNITFFDPDERGTWSLQSLYQYVDRLVIKNEVEIATGNDITITVKDLVSIKLALLKIFAEFNALHFTMAQAQNESEITDVLLTKFINRISIASPGELTYIIKIFGETMIKYSEVSNHYNEFVESQKNYHDAHNLLEKECEKYHDVLDF